MHPGLAEVFTKLANIREECGLSPEEVEHELILGKGWVDLIESGQREPTLGTLAAILALYNSDLPTFFQGLDFGEEAVIPDRHLAVQSVPGGIDLHFPMGKYKASVHFAGATMDECNDVLLVLRNALDTGDPVKAIVKCYLYAVQTWPHLNPSDLWYFFLAHAYQDDFNHPAAAAGKDWSQSWKRAGGWSLEAMFVEYYNPHLQKHGIELTMPEPSVKRPLLARMGFTDEAAVEKADVMAMGMDSEGKQHPFGVVHVKASLAERRTDDVPLSKKLIAANYASPLLTMDCKANPKPLPINKGELGPAQGGLERVSSKRLDIEQERAFDAVFTYNTNTIPTPPGSAAARIMNCNFSDSNDAFVQYLVRKWRDRQGL